MLHKLLIQYVSHGLGTNIGDTEGCGIPIYNGVVRRGPDAIGTFHFSLQGRRVSQASVQQEPGGKQRSAMVLNYPFGKLFIMEILSSDEIY
jgi:hypothetical protein